jgi:hypothetical protein
MTDEEGTTEKDGSKPSVRVIAPIEGYQGRSQVAPSQVSYSVSRKCAYHPNLAAVYICAQCQSPLCGNCAMPYGQLFICSQCYVPPQQPPRVEEQKKEPEKPPMESIFSLFAGLLLFIGFFLPWASQNYLPPSSRELDAIVSGFEISRDYPEVIIVFTMGILIMVIEFLIIILATSPSMEKKPPVGIRVISMFLGFICIIVLLGVLIRAETFLENIAPGWFVCFIGAAICIWQGLVLLRNHLSSANT